MFMEQLIQCYFVSLQVMITDTLEKWYFQQEDTDPDVHKGDGALYCVDGPVTVNLVDAEESFVLEPEDTFFLPAGTKYQLVNFENKPVKVVFAITEL